MLGLIGSKGACLRMREIVTVRRLFFSLFFRVPCASLQVSPLDRSSPLTAQMTRPRGVHVLFIVSLIKNIFPYFSPTKCEKCITPYGKFEELYLWHRWRYIQAVGTKQGVFGVAQSNCVIQIYPRLTLVAMATNRSYFNKKLAIARLK